MVGRVEKGTLLDCIDLTGHHACPSKFSTRLDQYGVARIDHINSGLLAIMRQVREIRRLAEEAGNTEIIQKIDEQIEWGKDLP